MTLLAYVFLFVASVVVTLGACALFTNAIEWLGKRRNLSEGAVGSVLAAIGTTLPETSIPIVAIFFGATREEAEVGLGAILGAPFMLSTLVVPMLALLLLAYARLGKRVRSFRLNYKDITVDLTCFSLAYMVALGCAFVPSRPVHMMAAIGLLSLYGYYVKLKFSDDESNEPSDLGPLLFSKHATTPSYAVITLQALAGLGGLALGAHLFVSAADATAQLRLFLLLILALPIAPLATELPEMSNSFLWLIKRRTGWPSETSPAPWCFKGRRPRQGQPGHRMDVGAVGDGHDGPCGRDGKFAAASGVGRSVASLVAHDRRGPLYRVCDVFVWVVAVKPRQKQHTGMAVVLGITVGTRRYRTEVIAKAFMGNSPAACLLTACHRLFRRHAADREEAKVEAHCAVAEGHVPTGRRPGEIAVLDPLERPLTRYRSGVAAPETGAASVVSIKKAVHLAQTGCIGRDGHRSDQ